MVPKDEKLYECDMPLCKRIATRTIDHNFQICENCYRTKRYKQFNQKKQEPKKIDAHKMEKIIETYLDLAQAVQNAGGSVSVIANHRDKPLSEFLENVCSTNNVRFKHDRNGS